MQACRSLIRTARASRAASRGLTTTSNAFLPEEVQMLQSAVRDFADAELVPNAGAWDKNGEMDDSMRQAIRGIGDMGLMGVAIDPEYGGTGMDYLSYAVAMEEVSVSACHGCYSLAIASRVCRPAARLCVRAAGVWRRLLWLR